MPYTKEHKNKTREKILKSAFELFTAKGFSGVTINELMKNCGLTRGAFYSHFSGKYAVALNDGGVKTNYVFLF